MSSYRIDVLNSNPFHEAWLDYVLGQPFENRHRSDIAAESYADGWEMAKETVILDPVRDVMAKQRELVSPQYIVLPPRNDGPIFTGKEQEGE